MRVPLCPGPGEGAVLPDGPRGRRPRGRPESHAPARPPYPGPEHPATWSGPRSTLHPSQASMGWPAPRWAGTRRKMEGTLGTSQPLLHRPETSLEAPWSPAPPPPRSRTPVLAHQPQENVRVLEAGSLPSHPCPSSFCHLHLHLPAPALKGLVPTCSALPPFPWLCLDLPGVGEPTSSRQPSRMPRLDSALHCNFPESPLQPFSPGM